MKPTWTCTRCAETLTSWAACARHRDATHHSTFDVLPRYHPATDEGDTP